MLTAKLGLGPMSIEIVEAIFKYSSIYDTQLMLIASRNQIDYNGGYVNNWNTTNYYTYIKELRYKYKDSSVLLCRDHCGPGFGKIKTLEDSYKTIDKDIECGFDLIHLDFSFSDNKLQDLESAINYCISLNKDIKLEIGTDENKGNPKDTIDNSIDVLSHFILDLKVPNIEFIVVQTGSLIKEDRQVGYFDYTVIDKLRSYNFNTKIKEHNADYLSQEEIQNRIYKVDALNIAPQLGIVQTDTILNLANTYNIDTTNFLNRAYNSRCWEKWILPENKNNKLLCARLAGHYVFCSDEYTKLITRINKYTNTKDIIINNIMKVIAFYDRNFKTVG